ncbi:hypothetical protein [Chromobacterium sphagni]|uniref:DUF4440 domain-containing protein n=1 Tax=Chromobacterium sphagni TaxID=1903179 RepID=A0A1S1WY62_9NEIS|nr:hypothetical protein [Chromobacterium sphagni]OHX12237.1 hypothetical protein BI347_01020 [Chromobacterium sphagni]OHX21679.1 hypothetical protein BI344_03990 [Chromobacterium sphagni]
METAYAGSESDKHDIDRLIADFFALFDNRDGAQPDLERIFVMFTANGRITKVEGTQAQEWSVEAFLAPRRILLSGGELRDFCERETSEQTWIGGDIASRISRYRKSGRLRGEPYAGGGVKLFQLIRGADGWRIAALCWQDQP